MATSIVIGMGHLVVVCRVVDDESYYVWCETCGVTLPDSERATREEAERIANEHANHPSEPEAAAVITLH